VNDRLSASARAPGPAICTQVHALSSAAELTAVPVDLWNTRHPSKTTVGPASGPAAPGSRVNNFLRDFSSQSRPSRWPSEAAPRPPERPRWLPIVSSLAGPVRALRASVRLRRRSGGKP